jgi:hypothetical protein
MNGNEWIKGNWGRQGRQGRHGQGRKQPNELTPIQFYPAGTCYSTSLQHNQCQGVRSQQQGSSHRRSQIKFTSSFQFSLSGLPLPGCIRQQNPPTISLPMRPLSRRMHALKQTDLNCILGPYARFFLYHLGVVYRLRCQVGSHLWSTSQLVSFFSWFMLSSRHNGLETMFGCLHEEI